MHVGRFIFSELVANLSQKEFQKCVAQYHRGPPPRKFSYWDQYLAMVFAQLTYRESLRDIEACLGSVTGKLYHLGFRGTVSRSTLADANENRDWRIFAAFAHTLIATARPLYADDPLGVDLDHSLYALDSTTIDLCLALFPWATFRKHKAAVKMHTLLDLHGNIPVFIRISEGKLHDVNALDDIAIETGAFYVFDRGYLDFARLYRFTLAAAFFVTRTKENVVLQRRYSHPVDSASSRANGGLQVYGEAALAFGGPKRALRSMETPADVFGGKPPIGVLHDPSGRAHPASGAIEVFTVDDFSFDSRIDRPVAHVPAVADFHHRRIQVLDRVDRLERPALQALTSSITASVTWEISS